MSNGARTAIAFIVLIVLASGVVVGVAVLDRQGQQIRTAQELTRSNNRLIRAVNASTRAQLDALEVATRRQLHTIRRQIHRLEKALKHDRRIVAKRLLEILQRRFDVVEQTFITEVRRVENTIVHRASPVQPGPPSCTPPPKCPKEEKP